jgi:3-oxoacyl-[acyl-carrier protein] reductase
VAERVSFVATDLTSPEEVERLFDQALERFFDLHVLVVNNVGQAALSEGKPLAETSLAEWNQNLAIHLRGPFLATQRALQEFLAGGQGGRIVLIMQSAASVGRRVGIAVAQSALRSFVRSVAKEYGRREIACNAVAVQGEPVQADAVAETVLFLASAEASFVNGEVLFVGNGHSGLGGGGYDQG